MTVPLVVQVKRRRWWRREEVERHWYECLFYPVRAWPLLFGLAILLTAFSGAIALGLSNLLADFRADASWLLWVGLPCFTIPLLILGYAASFLDSAFTSALAGEVGEIRWPGRDVGLALKSGVRWLLCFLAGPILPAGACLLFWIHGGDLGVVDRVILAEACLVTLSLWLYLIWAANDKDRRHDRNPLRVGALLEGLGQQGVALVVGGSAWVVADGWLASVALEKLHVDAGFGWLLLFLCLSGGLFVATFLFRWVGVWVYWKRRRSEQNGLSSILDASLAAAEFQ